MNLIWSLVVKSYSLEFKFSSGNHFPRLQSSVRRRVSRDHSLALVAIRWCCFWWILRFWSLDVQKACSVPKYPVTVAYSYEAPRVAAISSVRTLLLWNRSGPFRWGTCRSHSTFPQFLSPWIKGQGSDQSLHSSNLQGFSMCGLPSLPFQSNTDPTTPLSALRTLRIGTFQLPIWNSKI